MKNVSKGNAANDRSGDGSWNAMPVNFIGNVEGKDVFENVADVFVTDGFVGNVMLKTVRRRGAR